MTTPYAFHHIFKPHLLVWCSECGRVGTYHTMRTATPQRNWHELRHLEGVQGKQTVVNVRVILE